ncbi:DUF1569 domain-containing protein [Jiulongibacter sp. NS-SX5]|uniref:DUF1569 domain-containing protein n=1 Tax=Jiulongibacter sp. NS-SX5 TaxID=3463854 RepID=UPI004057F565
MNYTRSFDKEYADQVIARINSLKPNSQPIWGKMTVSQMLAHLSVAYEMTYEDKHPAPKGLMKLMLKMFVKNMVVGSKPYKKNTRTAPAFLITDDRDFETEKKRLIDFILKTQKLGANHFDGKENLSFGKLTKDEWSIMFAKHLDHHLSQFGI